MTTPENHIYATARAAALVLTHAEDLGLPAPSIVSFYDDPRINVHFERYEDLADWSTYAETPIEFHETKAGTIHHKLEATVLELEISAVYIEKPAPTAEPLPMSTFECDRCGASGGIVGMGPDEYGADDYFDEEVRRHESGECAPTAAPVAAVTSGCFQ